MKKALIFLLTILLLLLPCFAMAQGMGGAQVGAGGGISSIHKEITLYDPEDMNDEIAWFQVDSNLYPNGIEVTVVSIQLPADAAYTMGFERWDGDPPSVQATIEDVTTGAADNYKRVTNTDIDSQDVNADDWVYLDIPSTDVDWITVTLIGDPK